MAHGMVLPPPLVLRYGMVLPPPLVLRYGMVLPPPLVLGAEQDDANAPTAGGGMDDLMAALPPYQAAQAAAAAALFGCCVRLARGEWVLQEGCQDTEDARLSVRVANRLMDASKVAKAGMPSVERYFGIDKEHGNKLRSWRENIPIIRERYGHFHTMVKLVASVQLELYDKDPQNVFAIDPGCDLAADLGKQGALASARVFHHCYLTGIHICICLQHINNCIGGVRVMLMMVQLLRGVIDRWAQFAKEKPALAAAMASDGKHWGTTFEGSPYPGVTAYFEAPSESDFPASPKLAEIDASVDGATKFKRELVGGRMCKGRDYGLVTLARLLKGVSGASVLGANGARRHTGLAAFVGSQLSTLTKPAGGRVSESTARSARKGAMRFFQFYMLKAGDNPDEFGEEVEKDFRRCLAAQKLPGYQGAEFNEGMCEDVTALNYATKYDMAIDHSHETGEIRCITKCNSVLLGLGCIGYLRYLLAARRTSGS